MEIKLYNTIDSNNVIGKVLTDEHLFEITFKGSANITQPIVKITSSTPILYNYAYIENFGRYYYIQSINVEPNGMFILSLECDVLESFKTDILSSEGVITRNTEGNKYFGVGYDNEVRKEVDIYKNDKVVKYRDSTILVAIK